MRLNAIGAVLAAALGLTLAVGPVAAQNYSPGDTVKWRGMGAQTQKAMEDRERALAEKKQAQKSGQKQQGQTSGKTSQSSKGKSSTTKP